MGGGCRTGWFVLALLLKKINGSVGCDVLGARSEKPTEKDGDETRGRRLVPKKNGKGSLFRGKMLRIWFRERGPYKLFNEWKKLGDVKVEKRLIGIRVVQMNEESNPKSDLGFN